MNKSMRSQQGFVLVVALVFLIALTSVASMLMLNTTSDMKMAGATQERTVAIQEAFGLVDEVIYKQITIKNNFALTDYANAIEVKVTGESSTANISAPTHNITQVNVEGPCPASKKASSIFTCNTVVINAVKRYGNNNSSLITVKAGISQQLMAPGA